MDHCPTCHEELPRSTDGSVETLQKRILFLENELLHAVLAQPRCTEKAFQAYLQLLQQASKQIKIDEEILLILQEADRNAQLEKELQQKRQSKLTTEQIHE